MIEKKKIEIMEKAVNQYKKLPVEKKMFILGIMQGILINTEQNSESSNREGKEK